MRPGIFIFILFSVLSASSQKVRTVIPPKPVIVGTAFQVQYVISDPPPDFRSLTPDFKDFDVISGPHYYDGQTGSEGSVQQISNITYTLVASRTGKLQVPGIVVNLENRQVASEDAFIQVHPMPAHSFISRSSYTDAALYAPSAPGALQRLIDENLFIRTEVSKTSCYVGEAITASFKLYSRLQSESELVRVPSLYGFSVMDILDIRESHLAVETINGKVYNTSILRQVQLYPEQSGDLWIDEMVIKNLVEFDDSLNRTAKKIVEKELRSNPVRIKVKPLPANVPDDYNGAVGKYDLLLETDTMNLQTGASARIRLTIKGKGNFIQLPRPEISWPEGLDVFEPEIEEDLDTKETPARGKRAYTFQLVAHKAGQYKIPAVSLSYFDTDSGRFRQALSNELSLIVRPSVQQKVKSASVEQKTSSGYIWWIVAGVLFAIGAYFIYDKKQKKQAPAIVIDELPVFVPFSSRLELIFSDTPDERRSCIEISRLLLQLKKEKPGLDPVQLQELDVIIDACKLMAYSPAGKNFSLQDLKERAMAVVSTVEAPKN